MDSASLLSETLLLRVGWEGVGEGAQQPHGRVGAMGWPAHEARKGLMARQAAAGRGRRGLGRDLPTNRVKGAGHGGAGLEGPSQLLT